MKGIGDCEASFVFQQNNPGVFALNINNKQQESELPVLLFCKFHVCKITIWNIITIRWVYLAPSKFSGGRVIQLISQFLILRHFFFWSWWVLVSQAFFSKYFQTIDANPRWYPSYCGLIAIKNVLLCNTLSDTIVLRESLKSPYTIYLENNTIFPFSVSHGF